MCEPNHSIVSLPNEPDDDNMPFGGQMPMETRLKAALGQHVVSWGRRIKGWFHFSRFGAGHTSAIYLSGHSSLYLPEHLRYEGTWWNRKIHLDCAVGAKQNQEANETAFQYYMDVCVGKIRQFRKFLEESLMRSVYPQIYIEHFKRMLTPRGVNLLERALRLNFGRNYTLNSRTSTKRRTQIVACVMGYTRPSKRKLLVPEWADANGVWPTG